MPLSFDEFSREFDSLVADRAIEWEVVGFLAPDDSVYPFGTDTKVVSTVFEALSAPLVTEIAGRHSYEVESAAQTIYPDFTLTPADGKPPRIAIDVKTTYRSFNRRGEIQPFRYTLGSYTSFLRSPGATKNIKHPYAEYDSHWVIGFLYTRAEGVPAKVYQRSEVNQIQCPYTDVEYFVQEKYKIAGEAPGSGNTANIGSFPTRSIADLRNGLGPFASHGSKVCDDYWRNYSRSTGDRPYSNLQQFLEWRRGQTG